MRPDQITHIVVHCSATPYDQDIDADIIRRWHVNGNGWNDIGYHFVIKLDGTIESGRPLTHAGAHCRGINGTSWGICLVGGLKDNKSYEPVDWYTNKQKTSLVTLIDSLQAQLPTEAKVIGHYQYDSGKTCPNFDPNEWLNCIAR